MSRPLDESIGPRLLEAARAVARERSYALEMTEVARRADVSIGSLYRRFEDRNDLISELGDEMMSWLEFRLMRAQQQYSDNAVDWLREANRLGFENLEIFGQFAIDTFCRRIPEPFQEEFGRRDQISAYLGRLIKTGIDQGHFRADLNVRHSVVIWRGMVTPDLNALANEISLKDLCEMTSNVLLRGFRA